MITVREMIKEDFPQPRKLYFECRRVSFPWLDPSSLHLSDFEKDTMGEWVLVADNGSQLVGFSSAWLQDSFIHNLFIARDYQNKGIGRLLIKKCFDDKLRKPARLKCVVENKNACKFNERLGWRIESTTREEPNPYHTSIFD